MSQSGVVNKDCFFMIYIVSPYQVLSVCISDKYLQTNRVIGHTSTVYQPQHALLHYLNTGSTKHFTELISSLS